VSILSNDLLDYKASVPANITGGTSIVLPVNPGIQIADLGMFIGDPLVTNNRIELKGTVGLLGVAGNPNVEFRIYRLPDNVAPGTMIFNKVLTVESTALTEIYYTASFSTIDFNVTTTTGFVVYQLTAQVETGGTNATVIGPITFTGMAIGNVPA
jgi:hypothetical protein